MSEALSAAEGGTSAVARAAQVLAPETETVASADDSAATEESASYQKAITDFSTACKAAGVQVEFA